MSDPRENLDAKRCADTGDTFQPPAIDNPPGLPAIAYRIGTGPSFLDRMRERLPRWVVPDGPRAGTRPLATLDADVDDPAVALLDAWAVGADIVTFYQERIANEMFLGTAGEPMSVRELARLVGEVPGPGVAAGAFLAFTVETAPGAPEEATVPAGTQVVSVPGQDELPQTFETRESIIARASWNRLVPRLGAPQDLSAADELFLAGTETGLEPGDLLLIVAESESGAGQAAIVRADRVETDLEADHTELTFLPGVVVLDLRSGDRVAPAADADPATVIFDRGLLPSDTEVRVFALRERLAFFGHNAPRYGTLPREDFLKDDPFTSENPANDWDQGRTIWTSSRGDLHPDTSAFLAQRVPDLVPGSWAVILGTTLTSNRDAARVYRVTSVGEASLADYALSADVTALGLARADGASLASALDDRVAFDVRRSTAYVVSERLALADRPITDPFPSPGLDDDGARLVLDRRVDGLRTGQILALEGTRADGTRARQMVAVRRVDNAREPGHTTLIFEEAVRGEPLVRDSVVLNANVALASHGETVTEVLGSGDAGVPFQRFTLQRAPLTFDSAPVPGGVSSSLRVRVDGVQWRQVRTLGGQGPEAQVYALEVDDEGRATLTFGDGVDGARLPTGQENVTAVYRIGIGSDGAVAAGALSLLATRPLGIAEVTNPLAAAGAAPADSVDRVRRNAPVVARTAGRIVSLADFEDFALDFAGIEKARVAALGGVHLTVAGVGGVAIERGSVLFESFLRAVDDVRLPGPPLIVASYEPLFFDVTAKLVVDARFRAEDVFDQVRARLLSDFGFDRRAMAEPLFASDVLTAMQSVAGVVAVDLDAFHRTGDAPRAMPALDALPARRRGPTTEPAQLLQIHPDGITLGARTP